MVFVIQSISPNPRAEYHKEVEPLCKILASERGAQYRSRVFYLLLISGNRCRRIGQLSDTPDARRFKREFRLDAVANQILDELNKLYAHDPGRTDNLRGAVGEVFIHKICLKEYSNAEKEATVIIGKWQSNPIDVVGCSNINGHCIQVKSSLFFLDSIKEQHKELIKIESITNGKAKCAFITYGNGEAFLIRLRGEGIDTSNYQVFDNADLFVMENRISNN